MKNEEICKHLSSVKQLKPAELYECEECVKTGDSWMHLRTCQNCGATLCCDQSPNQHMTNHFKKTGHPVVASAEPDERWLWCYVDEEFVEY